MSFSLIQHADVSTGGGTTSSFTAAYSSNNTAGNFLVMFTREPSQAGATFLVSDSQSNSWQRALVTTQSGDQYEMWYAINCKGGANTITVVKSGGGSFFFRAEIAEFSGLVTTLFSSGTGTNALSPTAAAAFIAPGQTTGLLLGFFANSTADSVSPISSSDWTSIGIVDGNLAAFYKTLPVASPPTSWAANLVSSPTAQYCGSITALQASSSGVAVPGFLRQYQCPIQTSSQSTIVLASQTLTAGSVIILSITWNDTTSTVSSIADSLGNTWTPVANTLSRNAGIAGSQQHWISVITSGGTSTITITFSNNVNFPFLNGAAFSNINTTTPVQTSAEQTGNAAPVSPTISPTGNIAIFGSLFVAGGTGKPAAPPWVLLFTTQSNDKFIPTMYQLIISGQYDFVGEMNQYTNNGAGVAAFGVPAVGKGGTVIVLQ
jgi:hypothetical protein